LIRFGSGLAGARPRAGAVVVASYAYGGGRAGNVGVGALKVAPLLPAGFKAWNPLPTWGGDDGESVAAAERRIPLHLKHRDRAVSAEDFRAIVHETPGVALGRAEVRAAWHPSIGGPAPGVVTLLLVPDDPLNPQGPVPDRLFLQAVCRHLEPRRLVTTELHLRGPEYVPLSLSVGFDALAGVEIAPIREAITAALRTFLSPLTGGQENTGWPLDRNVEDRELWAQVARVAGVASVRSVRMFDSAGVELTTLSISGLRLPRLDRVSVRTGDAEDLAAAPPPAPPVRRVPVPIVPVSC
jgi:predicted phage baseplate assembly protein